MTTFTAHVFNTATRQDETVVRVSDDAAEAVVEALEDSGALVYSLWIADTCVYQSAMQPYDIM